MDGREGEEDEEYQRKNPFLCTISSSPSSSKIQFRKEVSVARWIEEMGMGEVVEKKGSMWTITGIIRDGKLYCQIEEILFHAERGALLLFSIDETLNMKDIYKKISTGTFGCSWESFEAYRLLKSLGYIVGRHGTPWTMKNSSSCYCSNSAQDISGCNEKSEQEVEGEISNMFNGLLISKMKPSFDVYFSNTNFKKSSPGHPDFMLCVLRENPPSRLEAEELQRNCDGIPLKFCFVDHGRICFFSFDKVVIPTLP